MSAASGLAVDGLGNVYVADRDNNLVRKLDPSGDASVLPFTGRFIDQRGPLPVAIVGTVTAATGSLGLGLGSTAPVLIVAAAALGMGIAVIQPALATMIVWCSTTTTRSRAFATQFFLNNLGLGIGGLIGGLLVDTSDPGSFIRLFSIEAAMFLVLGAVIATVRLPSFSWSAGSGDSDVPVEVKAGGGWRWSAAKRASARRRSSTPSRPRSAAGTGCCGARATR